MVQIDFYAKTKINLKLNLQMRQSKSDKQYARSKRAPSASTKYQ
jgi:hypothetical protein